MNANTPDTITISRAVWNDNLVTSLLGLKLTLKTIQSGTQSTYIVKIGPDCNTLVLKVSAGAFLVDDAGTMCNIFAETSSSSFSANVLNGVSLAQIRVVEDTTIYALPKSTSVSDIWMFDTYYNGVIKYDYTTSRWQNISTSDFAKYLTDTQQGYSLVNIDRSFKPAFGAISSRTAVANSGDGYNTNFFMIRAVCLFFLMKDSR